MVFLVSDVTDTVTVLQSTDYWKIIGGVLIAMVIFKFVWELGEFVISKTGITTRSREAKRKRDVMVDNHEKDIQSLAQQINDMGETVNQVERTVERLDKKLDEMQEKDDMSQRARIKDRIGQGYGIYHQRQQWTAMEREAFYDLIHSYEKHGGKNSFVHEVCLPESYTWKVIG